MPDYQGIGLGTKFLSFIAKSYKKAGYEFEIITSAKNMINALVNSDEWAMIRYSKASRPKTGTIEIVSKALRTNCKTASFKYTGD